MFNSNSYCWLIRPIMKLGSSAFLWYYSFRRYHGTMRDEARSVKSKCMYAWFIDHQMLPSLQLLVTHIFLLHNQWQKQNSNENNIKAEKLYARQIIFALTMHALWKTNNIQMKITLSRKIICSTDYLYLDYACVMTNQQIF